MVDSNFKDWYRLNATDLNARRRRRYDKDPEYRETVKELNTKARRKSREKFQREKIKESKAIKLRTSVGAWKTKSVEVDGVMVPMFTIGAVARVLGRGISTLRVWEKNGLLVATPYRASNGARLYTLEAIEHIRKVLAKEGKLQPDLVQKRKEAQFVVKKVRLATGETQKLRLYRVSTLARVVRRSPISILNLERRDRMPATPLRTSDIGIRLYTISMMEAVKDAFAEYGWSIRGKVQWGNFYDMIDLQWIKQGITRRTHNAPDAFVMEDEDED